MTLAWREYKLPARKKVDMKMKNGLTAITVGVDHSSVPVLRESVRAGDAGSGEQHTTEKIGVGVNRFI
jgi:hypothetical protein